MPPVARTTIPRSLVDELEHALRTGEPALSAVADGQPRRDRDRLLTLQVIHDLHVGDIDRVGDAVRWQHHPAVATLKTRLEQGVLAELDAMVEDDTADDAVAACQVGLGGEPKLELARNYWDEMGCGELDDVHTELHHQLCEAIAMPRVPREELPTSALLRSSLGGILATNRFLQPEMVGALGLLELQAGPRCRQVVKAFERLDAPAGAFPFYVEHRDVDPHHGKAWLDNAIAPLAHDPRWAAGMVRGARWRAAANAVFFIDMADRFADASSSEPVVAAAG